MFSPPSEGLRPLSSPTTQERKKQTLARSMPDLQLRQQTRERQEDKHSKSIGGRTATSPSTKAATKARRLKGSFLPTSQLFQLEVRFPALLIALAFPVSAESPL
eukprot:375857-Amphidinium_carterae.1